MGPRPGTRRITGRAWCCACTAPAKGVDSGVLVSLLLDFFILFVYLSSQGEGLGRGRPFGVFPGIAKNTFGGWMFFVGAETIIKPFLNTTLIRKLRPNKGPTIDKTWRSKSRKAYKTTLESMVLSKHVLETMENTCFGIWSTHVFIMS